MLKNLHWLFFLCDSGTIKSSSVTLQKHPYLWYSIRLDDFLISQLVIISVCKRLLSAGFKYGFQTDHLFVRHYRGQKRSLGFIVTLKDLIQTAFGNELMLWSFLLASMGRSSQGHVDASHNRTSHLPFLFYPTHALPQTASCHT